MAKTKKIRIKTKTDKDEKKEKLKPATNASELAETEETSSDKTEDPVKALENRIEKAEKESAEHYDRFLRLSAEFDNYKKRYAREMDDFRKFANTSIIKEMLSVVDNLERGLQSVDTAKKAESSIAEGVKMTLTEILKIFEKFAVKPIHAMLEPFDPIYHQAVMQEETEEQPDNTVIRELQKGYLIHDRLLRPSMVVVSKSTSSKKTGKGEDSPPTRLKKENKQKAHQNPDAQK
jgi:molecular chaperone GrpE